MEGYKSFREAVESVSTAADSWFDLSTGAWFTIDDLRQMGDFYDEEFEPDGWNYFMTFAETGEICLASTCTREIEFLFVPKGSRFLEVLDAQEAREEELREALSPVLEQLVLDKLEELGNDPEKFVSVFHRDTNLLAEELSDRADSFEKPGYRVMTFLSGVDQEAEKVMQTLYAPGLIEKTAASRNAARNTPEPLSETDSRTVLTRLDYCLEN